MNEQQIQNILDSNSYMECVKKIAVIYPNGFDIERIDKRIKDKLKELTDKYDSIQKPMQIRKKK